MPKNQLLLCLALVVSLLPCGGLLPLHAEPQILPHEIMPTISWRDAEEFIGREVLVVGRVVQSNRSPTGHAFLNFDPDIRGTLTVFINRDHYGRFPEPPDEVYRDKMVRVRGYVYQFRGNVNVGLVRPENITVLPDDTPLPDRPCGPAAPPPAGEVITIASYNVYNLFDHHDDPYTNDESTPIKPRSELEALATSIRALDADVLALSEVENRGYLKQFVRAFLADMHYQEVVLFQGNDVRGIDVAVLSRLPVGPVTSYRHVRFPDAGGSPIRFQRDLLRARIEPENGRPFEVFVVHFKSRGGDGGLPIRLGEARAVRQILDEVLMADPQAAFLLCGDFNDYIDSEPLEAILGSGPTALTTFVSDLSPERRITFNQRPHLSMIDFILASPAMAERYIPESYDVIVGGSPERTGSDHNPVVAKFRLR